MKDGYYWLVCKIFGSVTLVYHYTNPDTNEPGFGFNTRDGGGFMPAKDLSRSTEVIHAGYEERLQELENKYKRSNK